MKIQIPFQPSIPSYRFSVELVDTTYIIDVRWIARDSAWYFDISDEDEVPVRSGIKIVLGETLGHASADPRFPVGLIFAMDTSGEGREATLDDLGTRVIVRLYTPEEFLV